MEINAGSLPIMGINKSLCQLLQPLSSNASEIALGPITQSQDQHYC